MFSLSGCLLPFHLWRINSNALKVLLGSWAVFSSSFCFAWTLLTRTTFSSTSSAPSLSPAPLTAGTTTRTPLSSVSLEGEGLEVLARADTFSSMVETNTPGSSFFLALVFGFGNARTFFLFSFAATLTFCFDRTASSLPWVRALLNWTSFESFPEPPSIEMALDFLCLATSIRLLSSPTLSDARSSSAFSQAMRFERALSFASFSFLASWTDLSWAFLSFFLSTYSKLEKKKKKVLPRLVFNPDQTKNGYVSLSMPFSYLFRASNGSLGRSTRQLLLALTQFERRLQGAFLHLLPCCS